MENLMAQREEEFKADRAAHADEIPIPLTKKKTMIKINPLLTA